MKLAGRGVVMAIMAVLFSASLSLADEIVIPFGVYMDEFKAECKKNGLDLYGNRDSNGFVTDRAAEFSVFTYKQATVEQLDVVKEATWKTIRK